MRSLTKPQKIAAVVVFIYTAWIRLQDLGYSEYQGDEILTLDFVAYLKQGKFLEYLLTRDKGPLQYIINFITYKLAGGFDEFWIRLPYVLAGILFVWVIFETTRRMAKNNWAGIITAWLAASNGLFIAFSRITQYQAFVQLLLALTVLIIVNGRQGKESGFEAGKEKSPENCRLFPLAGLIFGLATLFHYDALTFLAFAGFYFGRNVLEIRNCRLSGDPTSSAGRLPRRHGKLELSRKPLKEVLSFSLPFLILIASFYIPFLLHPSANSTSGYLAERVFGSGFMPRTLYTEMLMKFYMPKELLYTVVVLACLSLYFILKTESRNSSSVNRYALSGVRYILPIALIFTFYFSTLWVKPRGSSLLFYFLTVVITGLLFLKKNVNQTRASVFVWFLASSCFYLFFNKTPRTHVYIIFIPMFILSGYSLVQLGQIATQLLVKLGSWLWPFTRVLTKATGVGVLAVGLVLIPVMYNYNIFIEKTPEYFWGNKTVFSQDMIHIEKNLSSKIQGIFGFPQRREWKAVAQLFENGCLIGTYHTNEKDRIPAFYLGQAPVTENADNIILVESPVSWSYQDVNKMPEGYTPLQTYFIGDYPVTKIYGKKETYLNGQMLCK